MRGGDVFETALVLAVEAVGLAFLVRGEQIEIAVAIEVPPHRADGLSRIADAGRFGDVDKAAAIVAQQSIRHIAERREQIEIAVAVVVDPRRLARHAVQVDADVLRDVDELRALRVVAIDLRGDLRIGEADVEIGIAVGVEIAPGRGSRLLCTKSSTSPTSAADVTKRAVVVAIEAIGPAAERDEVIEVAVVIDIRPGVGLSADGARTDRAGPARTTAARRLERRTRRELLPAVARPSGHRQPRRRGPDQLLHVGIGGLPIARLADHVLHEKHHAVSRRQHGDANAALPCALPAAASGS